MGIQVVPQAEGPPEEAYSKWRGEAWRRLHISRHTSHGGTQMGYSSRGGGQSIPWSLQSGSTTWRELAERLPYTYSKALSYNSGDKTLLL